EPAGDLGAWAVFQAAEDERLAEGLGGAGGLPLGEGPELPPSGAGPGGAPPRRAPPPPLLAPPGRGPSGRGGPAAPHSVERAGQGLALADRAGLPGQEEEGGLEGVLGILLLAQGAAADAQHHRPVPPQQRLERRLVVPGQEGVEQVTVGLLDPLLVGR